MADRSNGSAPQAGPPTDAGDVAVLERAAVRRLQANDLTVSKSAIGIAHARDVQMTASSLGAARIERATLTSSTAAVVVGRSVACDGTNVGVLAAPVVRGEVHTLIDLRSAFIIGLGMALGHVLIAAVRALAARANR